MSETREISMRNICFIISLWVCISGLSANNIQQITNRDGLSNSAILSMQQDKDGYMWLGTCDGLNLYNGKNVQVYKPTGDKINLSGNLIESILETEDNILWIHTNYGLNKLNKRNWQLSAYNQFKGLYFIEKDKHNIVYIINENSCIYYYHQDSDSFKKITVSGLVYNQIIGFTITSEDIMHIFMRDGKNISLTINRKNTGEVLLIKQDPFEHAPGLIYCFHEKETPDIIYFVDETYTLYEYNFVSKKKYYISKLEKEIKSRAIISSIIKLHDDFFIGFKTNGVLKLENISDSVNKYKIEDIGIKSGIFCLVKDRYQDVIWIGTDGHGVYMLSNNIYIMRSYPLSNFIPRIDKPVRALFMDYNRDLWIGTKGDGIAKINKFEVDKDFSSHKTEYITTSNSRLTDNSIYAFEKSRHNILWIGTELGLNYYSYDRDEIKRLDFIADGEDVKFIHGICELNDSTLWIATVGTGIVKARLKWAGNTPYVESANRIMINDGTSFCNYFFTIYNDSVNSTLWFGNRGYGAFYFEPENLQLNNENFYDLCENQTINDIYAINSDLNNNLWFGTSYGLLRETASGERKLFNQKDGLPNNTIHTILTDARDNLWLSTNQGIVRFNINKETFHLYNKHNGIQIVEFSDGAAFKDSKTNNLYFGGINGFVVVSETNIQQQDFLPPIYFGDLMIYGSKGNLYDYIMDEEGSNVLRLSHNQNFFSLSFTALDYINGYDYNYYYQLEGLSKQWIDNGASNYASFTSIPPGEYILHVKYKNKLTGIESPEYSLIIKISPPWYMSWWAYLVYTVLILICIIYIIKEIYVRNERKKKNAIRKLQQQHQEEVYESKLRFFTNIAHEFCTPLTLIYGPCNNILTYLGTDNYIKKNILLIQRNAERMNDLIQNLIEFRRIETDNSSPVIENIDVSTLIKDLSESFCNFSESKKIIFKRNIPRSLYWNSDKNFLYTIVTNLISNAFKYTNQNGTISLDIFEENEELCIVITNTGKGIKDQDLSRVFDRYMILDNFENQDKIKGSSRNGLGLAISYNMVKLLDGTIDVESTVNENTRFTVRIPQKEITQHAEISKIGNILHEMKPVIEYDAIIHPDQNQLDQTKMTILVIDDDSEILWLICEIFKNEYNVIPVNNSTIVEGLLLEVSPDIIISDIMMPQIDGISLTEKIKANKRTAHIPMILISAKHSTEEQIRGLSTGAQMYIAKPFDPNYLKTSVKSLLSQDEALKDYLDSPMSAFVLNKGKLTHKGNIEFIQNILSVINQNIHNPKLSSQFIAAELNISPRHMYRKLGEIDCDSPSEMIKESRMHIAHKYLLNSQMTIDEIVYKSGFTNRATFFRLFSQKYGCTPKEYRDKNISKYKSGKKRFE